MLPQPFPKPFLFWPAFCLPSGEERALGECNTHAFQQGLNCKRKRVGIVAILLPSPPALMAPALAKLERGGKAAVKWGC